jgi:hypothetical protein
MILRGVILRSPSTALRINSATKNLTPSLPLPEILRLRGACPELAEGLRLRLTVSLKFTLTDYYCGATIK